MTPTDTGNPDVKPKKAAPKGKERKIPKFVNGAFK
jgi:hypothetical protein